MANPINKYRIFIIDDHPVVIRGLSNLIDQEKELCVCGSSVDTKDVIDEIKKLKPDLIILDISLKDLNGLEFFKELKNNALEIPVLVLSMHDENLYAERSLHAGARGFIMKQEAPEKVILAIQEILKGNIYLSDKMKKIIIEQFASQDIKKNNFSGIKTLSERELEIFEMIGKGLSSRQIAESMFLSIKTIETYRARIKTKLNLSSSNELLQFAIQWVHAVSGD
ncbi:response regulator [Atribacter laminatus]|jgi:DNA-binding NarL/FixJ family response regulator|uniref:Oxygen regulatory protein NreC n=1 Tax=Atribacter laminatus TaxID=2847778 RepID=A0A7T1AKC2_ATRLM|nr:response regulator transcription factor [Atribacter laminatus]QPM67497.1 Oxygen regulatory protein NreC [Atribacter laminatus]